MGATGRCNAADSAHGAGHLEPLFVVDRLVHGEAVQQAVGIGFHQELVGMGVLEKSVANHDPKLGSERIEKSVHIEQAGRFMVEVELAPGEDFGEFLQRAEPARQGDEGIGKIGHEGFPFVHGPDDMGGGEAWVDPFFFDHETGNDPGDQSARREGRFGEDAHQSNIARPVDQDESAPGQGAAEVGGRVPVDRIESRTRPAINADAFHSGTLPGDSGEFKVDCHRGSGFHLRVGGGSVLPGDHPDGEGAAARPLKNRSNRPVCPVQRTGPGYNLPVLVSLRLRQLRCHEALNLDGFGPANLFLGENGRGKSSILEAIHLLARCRSYRTAQTRELVQWGKSGLRVEAGFRGEEFERLGLEWSEGKRRFFIDGLADATLREFWGRCAAVVFKNSDLALVQDRPALRRQWIDGLIAQSEPAYLPLVQRLQTLLKERNALLRAARPDRKLWEILTIQFWDVSEQITRKREHFSERLRPHLVRALEALGRSGEDLGFDYEPDFHKHIAADRSALYAREVKLGATQVGPQRDDWRLQLAGKPLKIFGSEGQQRSVSLAMRFAELGLVTECRRTPPVVLIDDVLHELDEFRREKFWSLLPETHQVFMATTRVDGTLPRDRFRMWNIAPSLADRAG